MISPKSNLGWSTARN